MDFGTGPAVSLPDRLWELLTARPFTSTRVSWCCFTYWLTFKLAQAFRDRTAHISDIPLFFEPWQRSERGDLDTAALEELSAITINRSSDQSSILNVVAVKTLLNVLLRIVEFRDGPKNTWDPYGSKALGDRWLDAMGFQSLISPIITGRLLFQLESGAVGLGPDRVQAWDTV